MFSRSQLAISGHQTRKPDAAEAINERIGKYF